MKFITKKRLGILAIAIAMVPALNLLSFTNPTKVLADDPQTVTINSPTSSQQFSSHNFSASGNMMVSPYANVKLDILLDGVQNQVVTTDGGGNWTANFTGVADGLHSVSAKIHKQQLAAIINASNNNVQLYDTEDDALNQTITSDNLTGVSSRLALKPDGTEVWIPITDGLVQVYDNASRTISHTISVPDSPIQVVFNTDGTKAYLDNNAGSPSIIVMDTSNYTVTQTIPLNETVNRMVISPDGSKIYLLNAITDNVSVVDTQTAAVVDTFSLDDGAIVTDMVISSDGNIMYVLFDSPAKISSYSTLDFTPGTTESLDNSGILLALNKANTNLYILDNTYKFYNLPIDGSSFNILDAHTTTVPDLTSADYMFLSEDETKVYITDPTADSLEWFDALSNSPTPTTVTDVLLNANTFGVAIPDLTTPQTLTTVNFSVVTGEDITPPSDPGDPTTASPTSNRRPTWTWTPSTDAFGIHWYTYQISGDPGFSGLFESGAVGGNSLTPASDLPNGTWYVRVMAWDNNDNHTSYFQNSGTIVFTPTFTSPAADSRIKNLNINFNFPQSTKAGSKKIILTPTNPAGSDKIINLTDTSVVNFTLDPHADPALDMHVASANFSSLTDGVYSVKLQYSDTGDYVTTITHANVTLDTVTQAPTLVSPVSSTTYSDFLPIQFTVPEAPLNGGLVLLLLNTDTSNLVTATLNTTGVTAGVEQSFILDTLNLTGETHISMLSPSVNFLEHGNYQVILSYQDELANPASIVIKTNVIIGYAGPHIRFTAPTTSSNGTITDTQIKVISEVNVLAANVTADNSSTAGYSDLNCTQTSAKVVDCTVKITSTGSFVLKATDANATTTGNKTYTITVANNNQNNSNNQESTDTTNNSVVTLAATAPVSTPVKTVTPVNSSETVSGPLSEVSANSNAQVPEQSFNFPWWVFIPIILGGCAVMYFIRKKGSEDIL